MFVFVASRYRERESHESRATVRVQVLSLVREQDDEVGVKVRDLVKRLVERSGHVHAPSLEVRSKITSYSNSFFGFIERCKSLIHIKDSGLRCYFFSIVSINFQGFQRDLSFIQVK